MSAAGGSVKRWGEQRRADARKGPWRRVLAWLGLSPAARRADAQAADCDAGAEGERRTAALLSVLEAEGWRVLHDRAIPGAHSANADHVLVSPGVRVFLVDSKLWSSRYLVHEQKGRLLHGRVDRGRSVSSIVFEATLVSRALGVPVQPVIAMHNAPVAGGGFFVQDVPVVPADRLVDVLRENDGPRASGAAWLGQLAAQRLPAYDGRT
ncbi:nuclease-related domain-containing protein [Streptomyces sp. NPDC056112]|uniref:nuclease-related domain-containing protein n=1 Tax=Streptomyces sp. NPDC056112 TaxID=3345715 RepID=UPI0035E25653